MKPFVFAAAALPWLAASAFQQNVDLSSTRDAGRSYQEFLHRFDYDVRAPLDVREVGVEDRGGVMVHDISYISPKGGRVPSYLVVPPGKGPFAAVIWGHWYWGNSAFRNRREFLDEAIALARSGLVSLLFDGPVARPGFYEDRTPLNDKQIDDRLQTILDVRRGADLLLERRDVDPARLGFVGHSYNASTGGYLAGADKRFKALVLMAGSLSDKVDLESPEYRRYRQAVGPEKFDAFIAKYAWLDPGVYLLHAAPAAVLMQFATKEDFLTVERARRYAALVSEPKEFKVYDAPHALERGGTPRPRGIPAAAAAARRRRLVIGGDDSRTRSATRGTAHSTQDVHRPRRRHHRLFRGRRRRRRAAVRPRRPGRPQLLRPAVPRLLGPVPGDCARPGRPRRIGPQPRRPGASRSSPRTSRPSRTPSNSSASCCSGIRLAARLPSRRPSCFQVASSPSSASTRSRISAGPRRRKTSGRPRKRCGSEPRPSAVISPAARRRWSGCCFILTRTRG